MKTDPLVTDVLEATARGESDASARLLPLVYAELRRLAEVFLSKERPDHTLQPTALVHEAYIRLVDETRVTWRGRTHFLAIAAMQMRRILIDSARKHGALRRGGGRLRVTLDECVARTSGLSFDVLALDEALSRLTNLNERQSRVVELRFFGGMTVEETAQLLKISKPTVKKDWRVARAWLLHQLRPDGE